MNYSRIDYKLHEVYREVNTPKKKEKKKENAPNPQKKHTCLQFTVIIKSVSI